MYYNNNNMTTTKSFLKGVKTYNCKICKESVFNPIYIHTCNKCKAKNICSDCIENVLLWRSFKVCRVCVTSLHMLNVTASFNVEENSKRNIASLKNKNLFTCFYCQNDTIPLLSEEKGNLSVLEHHFNNLDKYCEGSETVPKEFFMSINTYKIIDRRGW